MLKNKLIAFSMKDTIEGILSLEELLERMATGSPPSVAEIRRMGIPLNKYAMRDAIADGSIVDIARSLCFPDVYPSLAAAQIRIIKNALEARKTTTFVNLIPERRRRSVVRMANEAFPTKHKGWTEEQFREDTALNWLLKQEAFSLIASQEGFLETRHITASADVALLILTYSGSLLEIGKPDNDGQRTVRYARVPDRANPELPRFFEKIATSMDDLSVGQIGRVGSTQTSQIFRLAYSQDPGLVRQATQQLTEMIIVIDRQTDTSDT